MADKKSKIAQPLLPVEEETRHLLDMFEFYLTERHLSKPIDNLGEAVRDMRIIIGRILVDHFLGLCVEEEEKFCSALADMLADRASDLPIEGGIEEEYLDYCIGEMLTAFEYAQEIKRTFSDDSVLQKILALDIPILRPFDYGLQGKLKVIPTEKRKKIHS